MEEKIVGKKKGSSLFSDISFTLLSIASLSSVSIYTAPVQALPPLIVFDPWDSRRNNWKHKSRRDARIDLFMGRKGGEVHAFEPILFFG
jgi:hypothetical protein